MSDLPEFQTPERFSIHYRITVTDGRPIDVHAAEIALEQTVEIPGDCVPESVAAAGIVDQAIAVKARAVWMQLRIVDFDAAEKALAAGLDVVMDKCVKMEHGRFSGGLHWAGMNTEIITARKARR